MLTYLTSIELRRRWRGVALLALLVALVVGTVLASVAGARRSRSAFDRYLAQVHPPEVLANSENPEVMTALEGQAGVDAVLPIELAAVFPAVDTEDFFPMAVSLDGRIPYEYLRYPVVAGRLADPSEPLEVNLGERTAARLGVGLGDEVPLLSLSGETAAAGEFEPDGPELSLRVVGIVRDPGDIGSRESDITLTFLTPAFRELFDDEEIGNIATGAFVALAPGVDTADLARIAGPDVELDPSFSPEVVSRQANPTMQTVATGLLVFAGVAAAAGLAAMAHAVGRMQQEAAGDDATLAALGVSRLGRVARLAATGTVAVVAGVVVGVAGAVAASPRFPIGLARRAEPDPGLDVDAPVLVVGSLLAVVVGSALVVGLGVVNARLARRRAAVRVSWSARQASGLGAPSPVVTGLSLASGTPGAPGRTALLGTALGVLGVVAALGFSASLDHLGASPRLYGWGWDANIAGADLTHVPDGAVDEQALVDDPDLATVGSVAFQVGITLDGIPDTAIVAEDVKGHLAPVVLRGAAPSGPDEIAIGRDSLEAVGKDVGSRIEVVIGGEARTMRVSGIAALPVSEDGGSSTVGAFMEAEAVGNVGVSCDEDSSCYRNLAVAVRPGVDVSAIRERYTDPAADIAVDLPTPPGEIERLEAVDQLPRYLAAFLAVLAALAVTYVAAVTVRRRRADLAILRVLGMTASQLRAVVTLQVLALTTAGALVGTLLGIVAGRQVWRVVTDDVAVVFAPRLPVAAVVLVPLATIALTQAAASLSRRSAGRIKPAIALRTE